MKFKKFVGVFFIVFILNFVYAEISEENSKIPEAVEAEAESATEDEAPIEDEIEILYVTPGAPKASYLAETFDNIITFEKNWVKSEATKEDVDKEIAKYDGEWAVEPSEKDALAGDRGLVLRSKAKHAAISAAFNRPFMFKDKQLVVQYEVNFQNGQECGGAYIKLLTEQRSGLDLEQFRDKTPYTIMFGPDKCGNDYKLHFIFRHVNPLNKEIEEKHCKRPKGKVQEHFNDKRPHLYTLIIKPDNSYEIQLDHAVINTGNLLEDFTPSVNPSLEISDPNDNKPQDWDEQEKIPDLTAVKPDDWDEDAPIKIKDYMASMPDGWLEDEPEFVPDPEAVKPEDWDTEMDGEWEAALINNPACKDAPGCSEWNPPIIDNPNYKGKWKSPMINNPNYKGKWVARMIKNPEYFEDLEPFKMSPIRGVGIELWSMSDGIYFDNILVTDSAVEAVDFAAETFDLKIAKIDRGQKGIFKKVIEFSNLNPWIYGVYVLVVAIPVVLIFVCCCAEDKEDKDAERKKTDEPTEDDPKEGEEDEQGKSGDEEKVGSSQEEEEEEARKSEPEPEPEPEPEAGSEEEMPELEKTTPRTSPRLRKVRKE